MAFEGTLQDFTVNMHGPELEHTCIEVQQGDTASRRVRIHLKDFGGADFQIPYGATAVFCINKADGHKVYNACEIEDESTVIVTLSNQAIACAGRQKAQIYLSKDGWDIKTQTFTVNVPRAIYTDDAIKSSDEFGILSELIAEYEAIVDSAGQSAASAADSAAAAEAARQATEQLKQDKDYVTPQMYGAKGDGVHDDTVALQSAIDSGKSVLLPIGNYLVSNTININATTEISGYGLKSAIVLNNDIGTNYLFNVADRLHVGFNNFRIYGKDHIGNAISIGLTYENTILRDMYVDGFKGCLLNLGKLDSENISENVTIENCTFNATSNNGTWNQPIVKIVNQNELRFNGNRLQFASVNKQNNPCLHALGVRTSAFCSNIFFGSDDCAFYLVNSNNNCYGNSFMNNVIEKCGNVSGYSVKLIGSNGRQITNISFISNYIYASSARKIRLDYINAAIFQGQLYEIEMSNCYNVARIDTTDATLGYTPSSGNAELLMNGEDISIHRRLALMGKTKTERGTLQYNDGNQILLYNGIYTLKMVDNDLFIDSNDGALMLRDSSGKVHYIRVNNNGELKVTDN